MCNSCCNNINYCNMSKEQFIRASRANSIMFIKWLNQILEEGRQLREQSSFIDNMKKTSNIYLKLIK